MKRVTPVVANAMAMQACSKIKSIKDKKVKAKEAEIRKSKAFQEMQAFSRHMDRMSEKYSNLRKALEKKHGVSITKYNSRNFNIHIRVNDVPPVADLKNEIIIANHIEGVDETKLVDHIVKKHS